MNRLLPLGLMLLATTPLAAQQRGRAARPGPVRAESVATVEGMTEYRLPNGLRIVLFPDAARPSTTVNITYFVGSRHEAYGESGMAHLLEHLVFKGSPRHQNIPQELTEHGGRANGTTWYDRTNYFITFPTSDANLEWAIGLESDRMVNSYIRGSDLETEMTVVRNEFEAGENNPFGITLQRTMAAAYLWHGYGRSTIGARADLEGVPIERLQAFYRKYYQPDNAILVISGTFDKARTLRWIERDFGPISRPDRTGPNRIWPTYTREPVQDGERSVTLRRVGDTQYLMAFYHVPAGSHPDHAPVDLLGHVLSNAPSGRLYQALVAPGLASSVGWIAFPLREPGPLILWAQIRMEQSIDSVRGVMLRTIDALATNPPTAAEVERARAARVRDIQLSLNNSENIGINITEWAATGDWRLLFMRRDRLRATTEADVARVAREYLRPANRTVGQFIPDQQPLRASVPEAPDVAAMVAGYRGTETIATGEAFEATATNIEARLRRITLPNGFQLALLPKQTRGGGVSYAWAQRMGNEQALNGKAPIGSLTAGMLMRGTARRNRQEFTDELARLQAQLFIGGSATLASGSGQTTRDNLIPVLRLIAEAVRTPAFDAQEFETLRRDRLAQIESQRTEPGTVASLAFSRHMSPRPVGHPLYTETVDEAVASLQAVTLDQVRQFHREFYGAGRGGSITVIGDFDPAAVEAAVRELFGEWPRQQEYTRIPVPFTNPEPQRLVLETADKPNAVLLAGANMNLRDDHPDYPSLLLAGYMLGGGFLNSRLAARIRQREGLSYGIGGFINGRPIDTITTFTAQAIYAPQNADRLMAAFREEIERAVREGFTDEEIAGAKRGWLQQQTVGRTNDQQLVGQLQNGMFLGRTLSWDQSLEGKVEALTREQINSALSRHLDPNRITTVQAGSFSRPPATPAVP